MPSDLMSSALNMAVQMGCGQRIIIYWDVYFTFCYNYFYPNVRDIIPLGVCSFCTRTSLYIYHPDSGVKHVSFWYCVEYFHYSTGAILWSVAQHHRVQGSVCISYADRVVYFIMLEQIDMCKQKESIQYWEFSVTHLLFSDGFTPQVTCKHRSGISISAPNKTMTMLMILWNLYHPEPLPGTLS